MEDNKQIIAVPVQEEETKVCERCGKELPLSSFHKRGKGYRNICKDCCRVEDGSSDKFRDFTSKELIDELIARGYRGKLTKVVEKEFVLR